MSEDVTPYPTPQDRVEILVFCRASGIIRQYAGCALEDMHRQHGNFDNHDYLEVTGQGVARNISHTHVVDLKTLKLVPRTAAGPAHIGMRKTELMVAHREASKTFSSSASGKPRTYEEDLTAFTIASAIGGELKTDSGQLVHTPEQAKAVLQDYAVARQAAGKKLEKLYAQIDLCKTIDEVNAVSW